MRRWVRWFALVVLVPALAPADIEEQRARLPPPAEACPDPVEGTWVSENFYPQIQGWMIFDLEVRRDAAAPGGLTLRTHSEHWGPERDSRRQPCAPGAFHRKKYATAVGTTDGTHLSFRLTALGAEEVFCGIPLGDGYELATFAGTIDHQRQEFVSVFEADTWHQIPTVFRRVRCLDQPAPPALPTPPPPPAPPPLMPPRASTGGCGCSLIRS